MEDTPRSELQQAHQPSPPPLASPPSPSTVAPGVAAFLRGQASIVYLSNRIEAEYLAQGMAGAGYPDSQLAGDGEPAWRIARAVEQLSLQAGLYPGASAAESFVGDHAGQPAGSFSSSSSMAGSTPYVQQSDQHQLGLGSQAFAPQSYHSASTSALFDQGAYYAALGPQPQVLAANSRLDYSRAMQHHLSQQFASASLAESQQVFGSPAMMSTVFTSPLLHQATAAGRPVEHRSHLQQQQQLQQHQQPAYNGLTGNGYHGFLPSSAMTPLTSIIPPSIAPPTTASPKPADRRASAGSTLATLPETSFGAPAMCFESPPSYDSPPPELGPSTSASTSAATSMSTTASSSRAFSVPAGIKPEAAAAHYAWNASLNAMDPDKKFICPIPSCGRGFKRIFNLKAHMNSHAPEGGKRFPCTVEGCPKGFSRKHDMERHRTAAHPDAEVDESTTVEGRRRMSSKDASRSKTL